MAQQLDRSLRSRPRRPDQLKSPPERIVVPPPFTRTWSRDTAKCPRLVTSVPAPRDSVIVPTGVKSSVTCSTVPSGRFTFLTCTVRIVEPPLEKRDMSASACPCGTIPPMAGTLSVSLVVPPVPRDARLYALTRAHG